MHTLIIILLICLLNVLIAIAFTKFFIKNLFDFWNQRMAIVCLFPPMSVLLPIILLVRELLIDYFKK